MTVSETPRRGFDSMTEAVLPPTRSLEDLAKADNAGPWFSKAVTFRLTRPMYQQLSTLELSHKLDKSQLIRCLLMAGAERYGIDLTAPL